MPALQRGSAYKLKSGGWGLQYRDRTGKRCRKSPFANKNAALAYFRDVIEPELRAETVTPELTLSELVELYLERHAVSVRERTIMELRKRLRYAVTAFGDVSLRDLERMSGEIASWRATLPERSRYGVTSALRQTLEAGCRWGHISTNPAKLAGRNPQPPPRAIRTYTGEELEAIAAELSPAYRTLPVFCAEVGLRPEEWGALERRDIDRHAGFLTLRQTISSGRVVELGKTTRSRRQVPLSARALGALDSIPPRLDTPYVFPAHRGGAFDLANFRRRQWRPAIEAAGIVMPARIYDLRSTFASNALAARISIYELARIMGTSIGMIERHYGALLDGSGADIARRLDAFAASR
jgi:integrase